MNEPDTKEESNEDQEDKSTFNEDWGHIFESWSSDRPTSGHGGA